jgi:hypothetical protein
LAFVNVRQEVDFSCSLGLLLEGKHIF